MAALGALLYGKSLHHLDHLAPLAAILKIPLLCSEEELAALAENYYPGLTVHYLSYLEIPEKLITSFDTLFTCLPRPLFDDIFGLAQTLLGKRVETVWIPHGNSDKGYASELMEGLRFDTKALFTGQKMIDFFQEKGAFTQIQAYAKLGNYRYRYYLEHKAFYDNLLPYDKPLILYAPTWQDGEQSSSLGLALPHLRENPLSEFELIIRPHPNSLPTSDFFPPIYPLLSKTAIYLGDMSSIGYDFLTFDRPMFFLNSNQRDPLTDKGLYLHRCGLSLTPDHYPNLFKLIAEALPFDRKRFSAIRKQVYAYAFT